MTAQIQMKRERDCKHSVRFQAEDPKAPIRDVYISRDVPEVKTAQTVTVTLEIK